MTFSSRRSSVYACGGMVATSQPLAVQAGIELLRQGGNAADAAVAAAAALAVTEPTSTGLGGDAFVLYYNAAARQVSALNGSGRAPYNLSLERLQREGLGNALPPFHPYNITVPGACAAWCDLVERFGRCSLGDILQPALRLAQTGFPVAPVTAYFWQRSAQGQLAKAFNGREMTIDGRGPQAGEIFKNPGMTRTLAALSARGRAAYYNGEIGEEIVRTVQEAGGCLEMADLEAHASDWVEPIWTDYRGWRIWECPPNGQGMAALLALNLLEGYDLKSMLPLSAERLHLEIEAMRLAFADAFYYAADPRFAPAPSAELLGKPYAAERRKLIDTHRASHNVSHGAPCQSSDTVYLSVVDGEGNACSFINSNYMGFGTGIVPRGWGFSLQNRGANFNLDAAHPNALAPGKRPYHTIIPAMATDPCTGDLLASFGVMGGFMQPQGHMQVVTALLDDGLDPQSALDRPRFCLEPEQGGMRLAALEEGIPDAAVKGLQERGHAVRVVQGMQRALFGRGQIILRDPRSGVLCGGSDPRADGCAQGL